MDRRILITPGSKVSLNLSAVERRCILDLKCLDDDYFRVIQTVPADQPIPFTLDEWEDIGGYVAAKTNDATDEKPREELANVLRRILEILASFTETQLLVGLSCVWGIGSAISVSA
jgi:hypothetical protein